MVVAGLLPKDVTLDGLCRQSQQMRVAVHQARQAPSQIAIAKAILADCTRYGLVVRATAQPLGLAHLDIDHTERGTVALRARLDAYAQAVGFYLLTREQREYDAAHAQQSLFATAQRAAVFWD